MGNYGWIEIVLFYGLGLGICIWQYLKMDRELKQAKAERAEKQAQADNELDEEAPTAD